MKESEKYHIKMPSVSLQEYIEMKMDERDRRYEDRFAAKSEISRISDLASERALALAERSVERVSGQVADAMPRSEYAGAHKSLVDALDTHIKQEVLNNLNVQDRVDEKLKTINERLDGMNKWLIGALGGVTIALIMTLVDILVRVGS